MKLFAPYIDNKIPAFCGNVIIIPFNLNKGVSEKDFKALSLKVNYSTTNIEKCIVQNDGAWWKTSAQRYEARFILPETEADETKMYYKVQLAFVGLDDEIGYYSTVGVVKKTNEPTVVIKDRENSTANAYEYFGYYFNEDSSEKVATYCFNLYNENNDLVTSSGELIHNRTTDLESTSSIDSWVLTKTLEPNVGYEIEYVVNTINGLRQASARYPIVEVETVPPNIHARFIAEQNFENGYITLKLCGDRSNINVSGSFVILRSSEEDNFETWHELTKFYLTNWSSNEDLIICKDYTAQQGLAYKYAIQAYNSKGLRSDKMLIEGETVSLDFEDAFLYDGKKQLKIRFNPKISSFKNVILESKMDTIGGKYPFVFRNGNVNYKEFPISGLLSLVSDEEQEFSELGNIVCSETTQLTKENYYKERKFKLDVLSWLTNGEPKLFRSPAEGNYIVRLMNVNLTPVESIGRLLHTFNATAYEIADCTFENLKKYNLITESYIEHRELKINQISLSNPPEDLKGKNGEVVLPKAYLAQITAKPNTDFYYTLAQGTEKIEGSTNLTGTFVFPTDVLAETPLLSVAAASTWDDSAKLTYGYYDSQGIDNFSYISAISISDKIMQLIGTTISRNIVSEFTDIRSQVGACHYLRAKKRNIENVYYNGTDYYLDSTMQYSPWPQEKWLNTIIYYDVNNKEYYDGNTKLTLSGVPDFTLIINDQILDLGGTGGAFGRYDALTNIGKLEKLYIGNGVIVDLVLQLKEISYSIEEENATIQYYKKLWLMAKSLSDNDPNNLDLEADMDMKYSQYVTILEQELSKIKGEYGHEYAI